MMSDAQAREVVIAAFQTVHGRDPNLAEAQFFGALGMLEGGYGSAFSGAHNWGGVHACKPPEGAAIGDIYQCQSGPAIVVQESKDGNVAATGYLWGMRVYPDDTQGEAHVLQLFAKNYAPAWELVKAGKGRKAVYKMSDLGYFGLAPEKYVEAVKRASTQIANHVDGGNLALDFGGSGSGTDTGSGDGSGSGKGAGILVGLGLVGALALKLLRRKR